MAPALPPTADDGVAAQLCHRHDAEIGPDRQEGEGELPADRTDERRYQTGFRQVEILHTRRVRDRERRLGAYLYPC